MNVLNYDRYQGPDEMVCVIVHGLFGSARNWRAIARQLSKRITVVCVDLRNHGGSFHDDDMTYFAMAADLRDLIVSLGKPAIVMGHSMGGKAAMTLALQNPELVHSLMVADIAPVSYQHSGENVALIDAMLSVDLAAVGSRKDADKILENHDISAPLRAFFLQSLILDEAQPRWALNLPVLRRAMPHIVGFPDLDGVYGGPAFFLAGAASDYVDDQGRATAQQYFPSARFARLKGAGHWLHAEQPRAFIQSMNTFIDHVRN